MKSVNNTVLITGGGSGIGLELATQLISLGNEVIITGRDLEKLKVAAKGLPKLHIIQSDVSSTSSIKSLYAKVTKEFPRLNVLINNAGIMRAINLNDTPSELSDMTTEIETNLSGLIQMTAQFLPQLKKQKNAGIMNVSSGLAFVPLAAAPVYCATKAAVHSYTQSLRVQLKQTNVTVFELAPPLTETPLIDKMGRDGMEGIKAMSVQNLVGRSGNGRSHPSVEDGK